MSLRTTTPSDLWRDLLWGPTSLPFHLGSPNLEALRCRLQQNNLVRQCWRCYCAHANHSSKEFSPKTPFKIDLFNSLLVCCSHCSYGVVFLPVFTALSSTHVAVFVHKDGFRGKNLRSLASTNASKLDLHPYHALSMTIATKWHTTDTDGSEANSANKLSTMRDMTPGSCSVPILTGSWICRVASLTGNTAGSMRS